MKKITWKANSIPNYQGITQTSK